MAENEQTELGQPEPPKRITLTEAKAVAKRAKQFEGNVVDLQLHVSRVVGEARDFRAFADRIVALMQENEKKKRK